MEYRVQGLDEATGKQCEILVKADSAGEAKAQARQLGLRPSSVAAVDQTPRLHKGSSKWGAIEQGSRTRPYPALRNLASWYRIVALVTLGAALIGAVIGVVTMEKNLASGLLMLVACLVGGLIGVISFVSFAEGIELAIDIAADLRDIRDRLSEQGERAT